MSTAYAPKRIHLELNNVPPCNFGALWYEEPVEGAVEYVLAEERRWIPVGTGEVKSGVAYVARTHNGVDYWVPLPPAPESERE